jgi:16S rRNA (cytosine967-C5)-methyltransferase
VQDAAAALVVRLAGDVAGRTIADLCAAPGGKTAQLAAAGAQVTAVDVSAARLARLRDNLARLHLQADVVEADAATWSPGRTFDIVILDAPCSATGTIRRHPDILRLKRADDIARMADLQRTMLANAAGLVAPGGLLLYATCSLEPEEGERQVAAFLDEQPQFQREGSRPRLGRSGSRLVHPPWRAAHAAVASVGHGWVLRRPPAPHRLNADSCFPTAILRRSVVSVVASS